MRHLKLPLVLTFALAGIACDALVPRATDDPAPETNAHESGALAASPANSGQAGDDILDMLGPTLGHVAQRSTLRRQADAALRDLFAHFWLYDDASFHGGHIAPTFWGRLWNEDPEGRLPADYENKLGGLWDLSTFYNALYSHWKLTGAADDKAHLQLAWSYIENAILSNHEHSWHNGCGKDVKDGFAQDDLGWWTLMYLQAWEVTGSPHALQFARETLNCAIQERHDGPNGSVTGRGLYDWANGGFWYTNEHILKSTYQGSLALAALWLYQIDNTPWYLEVAINTFKFTQSNMHRPDGLYWCEYGYESDDDTLKTAKLNGGQWPLAGGHLDSLGNFVDGGHHHVRDDETNEIGPTGSVSFLGGNMAMALLGARLANTLGVSGRDEYRRAAIDIAHAILESRETGPDLVYVDDRDGWTDGHFAYSFATEVLTLPGVRAPAMQSARNTALAIYAKDRIDGFYGADWNGPADPSAPLWSHGVVPQQIYSTTSAINLMIAGAALP
jgi:hypothetical protein